MNEKQARTLLNLQAYCYRKGLYVDFYSGVSDPDYSEGTFIAAGNWNDPKSERIARWGEKFFGSEVEFEWQDEWSPCGGCGNAVRTEPDSHDWKPFYVIHEEGFVCGNCSAVE